MGRGRAKAKQTKVARQLKYNTPEMDLDSLQRELASTTARNDYADDVSDAHDEDEYSEYADQYGDYSEWEEDEEQDNPDSPRRAAR